MLVCLVMVVAALVAHAVLLCRTCVHAMQALLACTMLRYPIDVQGRVLVLTGGGGGGCHAVCALQLRVSKVTGGAPSKLAKIKVVRKSIARVLTVYNQTQKAKVRAHMLWRRSYRAVRKHGLGT